MGRVMAVAGLALALICGITLAADADGLVAHYAFDEGQGLAVDDSTPNKNAGQIKGDTAWVKGISGMALSFNGTNGYVEVPASDSLDLKNGTIEAWVYARTSSGGISFAPSGRWEDQRFVCSLGFREPPLLCVAVGDGKAYNVSQGGVLPVKQWCHVAVTCDGKSIVYYLNGAALMSVRQTVTPVTKGVPLAIGKDCGLGPDFFNGIIDEVSVYNRALSADEIAKRATTYAK